MNSRRLLGDLVAVGSARVQLRGAKFGGWRVRMFGRARVLRSGRVEIGDRVQLYSTLSRLEIGAGPDGRLVIGEGTLINFGASVVATQLVTIGRDCQIGPYVMIMDNAWHRIEPERRLERPESRPVVIEDNVWLGTRSIVMPGVRIGRDACVGAGSVVTKDVPERVFVAGVPARFVRQL